MDGIVGAYATPASWSRPDGSTIWEFLDSYPLATEDGRLRILGDLVHR